MVFRGILFEFGKTVRILSRIFEVYIASCVLEYLRILSYTPRVPIRIRENSVANMCLFAQCLFSLYNNIFFIVHVLFMIVCCLIFLASSISSPISQVCSVYVYWLWWIKRVLFSQSQSGKYFEWIIQSMLNETFPSIHVLYGKIKRKEILN